MPMRSPGGGSSARLTGAGFAAAGRATGFFAFGAARRTGAFFAGFFAVFLRAAGRLAGAFLGLAFAFFRTAMFASIRTKVAVCYSTTKDEGSGCRMMRDAGCEIRDAR